MATDKHYLVVVVVALGDFGDGVTCEEGGDGEVGEGVGHE